MATGEIRLSILWEWLHKGGKFTEDNAEAGVKKGEVLTEELFSRLLAEEFVKLQKARNVDVHDNSKKTTLPVSRIVVDAYVRSNRKAPWMVDLLNINLTVENEEEANKRTQQYLDSFSRQGIRITKNLDFDSASR
jgi:malate synthase